MVRSAPTDLLQPPAAISLGAAVARMGFVKVGAGAIPALRSRPEIELVGASGSYGGKATPTRCLWDRDRGIWRVGSNLDADAAQDVRAGFSIKSPVPLIATSAPYIVGTGESVDPVDLTARIIGNIAGAYGGRNKRRMLGRTVVTIPADRFAGSMRDAVDLATRAEYARAEGAEHGALELLEVLDERVAALTTAVYENSGSDRPNPARLDVRNQMVLLCDWGAGALRCTLLRPLELSSGVARFAGVGTVFSAALGTQRLYDVLAHHMAPESGVDVSSLNHGGRWNLRDAVRIIVEQLNDGHEYIERHIDGLPGIQFTRNRLETLLRKGATGGMLGPLSGLLGDIEAIAEATGGTIRDIVCVGGGAQLPMLTDLIAERFPRAVNTRFNDVSSEAVVRGASLRAAQLEGVEDSGPMVMIDWQQRLAGDLAVSVDGIPGRRIVAKQGVPWPSTTPLSATIDGVPDLATVRLLEQIRDYPYEIVPPTIQQLAAFDVEDTARSSAVRVTLYPVGSDEADLVIDRGAARLGPVRIAIGVSSSD
jgi:molecular chaperone DnaK (HSP70)